MAHSALPGMLHTDELNELVEPVSTFRVFAAYGAQPSYAWARRQYTDERLRCVMFNFTYAAPTAFESANPRWRVARIHLEQMLPGTRYRQGVQSLPHILLRRRTLGSRLGALFGKRVALDGPIAGTHVVTSDHPERAHELLTPAVCSAIVAHAGDAQIEMAGRWLVMSAPGALAEEEAEGWMRSALEVADALFVR